MSSFIFQYIDSVEQLEVLLLMSSEATRTWSADELSRLLRSNSNSVEQRLKILCDSSLIVRENEAYRFSPAESTLVDVIHEVSEVYKTHRHRLLEMIFSPSKKARDFSDAFRVKGSPKKGDGNG